MMASRCRGFTLLELLVVMALVAVMLTLAVPRLEVGPAQQARQQGRELAGLIEQLREAALAQGKEYGLHFDAHGYRLMVWHRDRWQQQAVRHLPAPLVLRLELEGQPLRLGEGVQTPQVLILSSDQISAFSLHYETTQGGRWLSLASDDLSTVTIHEH